MEFIVMFIILKTTLSNGDSSINIPMDSMINIYSFTTSWRLHHYVNGNINNVETDSVCLNEYDPIGYYTVYHFIDDMCFI